MAPPQTSASRGPVPGMTLAPQLPAWGSSRLPGQPMVCRILAGFGQRPLTCLSVSISSKGRTGASPPRPSEVCLYLPLLRSTSRGPESHGCHLEPSSRLVGTDQPLVRGCLEPLPSSSSIFPQNTRPPLPFPSSCPYCRQQML